MKEYQQNRNALPQDSDGIYILIKGEAKVINKCDKNNFELAKISQHEFFGESRLLNEPSYSYFGDVVACSQSQT